MVFVDFFGIRNLWFGLFNAHLVLLTKISKCDCLHNEHTHSEPFSTWPKQFNKTTCTMLMYLTFYQFGFAAISSPLNYLLETNIQVRMSTLDAFIYLTHKHTHIECLFERYTLYSICRSNSEYFDFFFSFVSV